MDSREGGREKRERGKKEKRKKEKNAPGLSRPGAVSFHLCIGVGLTHGCVLEHEGRGLVHCPALGVKSGVYH